MYIYFFIIIVIIITIFFFFFFFFLFVCLFIYHREWYSNLIMKTSYIVSSCDTAEKVKTEFNDSTKERTGTGYIKKFKSSLT